jgi:CRP/FNR family nitrogen fixation transcriptional regulator
MLSILETRASETHSDRDYARGLSRVSHFPAARTVRRHETVYSAGDPADYVYEVIRGTLLVHASLEDGRRQIVYLARRGDVCGFATGSDHMSTCEALETSTIAVVASASLSAPPNMQAQLLQKMAKQIEALHEQALTLGRKTANERVAWLLARFALEASPIARLAKDSGHVEVSLQLPMTRGQIADYLGLTLETVCREMRCLAREDVIAIGPRQGQIKILRLACLMDNQA